MIWPWKTFAERKGRRDIRIVATALTQASAERRALTEAEKNEIADRAAAEIVRRIKRATPGRR